MTDTERRTPDSPGTLEDQAERLEDDAGAMDRPDRVIPLPDETEDDEGAGPATGLVP